jgi:hypothetical protein
MNVSLTPKENNVLHTLLSVVTERMTQKRADDSIPFELLSNIMTKLEQPDKEDPKTLAVLKKSLGAAAMPTKTESFKGVLMVKMYEESKEKPKEQVNEQGNNPVEVYKQDKVWYLRGLTNVEAKMEAKGIDALWKRGADKEGAVFTTESDDVAMGVVKSLELSKKESTRTGATDYYSK